jgi:hypothetical protein
LAATWRTRPFDFVGSGLDFTDARLGPTQIPAANFSWNIYMRHNTHRHDFAIGVPGANLSFTTPLEGELSVHQAFEVVLFATDAGGSTATATAIIPHNRLDPPRARLSGGGTVLVDGVPLPLPSVFTTIAGQGIALAPGPDLGRLRRWSDARDGARVAHGHGRTGQPLADDRAAGGLGLSLAVAVVVVLAAVRHWTPSGSARRRGVAVRGPRLQRRDRGAAGGPVGPAGAPCSRSLRGRGRAAHAGVISRAAERLCDVRVL